MADPDEVQEWLNKADEDRLVVEVLMRTGEELTLPCMFHLQQMLEKLLKALILTQDGRFERTHDLTRLATLSKTEDVQGLSDISETLNLFAVNGRYPGDQPEVSMHAARQYRDLAFAVRGELLVRIKRMQP
jgi:HEPN domain-containing protein